MEKQKDRVVELREVCGLCGKVKAKSSQASLTSWIFQDTRCKCPAAAANDTANATSKPALPTVAADSNRTDHAAETSTESTATIAPEKSRLEAALTDRYEILEKLGEGGMGTVYKVKDKVLNKTLAIKVLRDEIAKDQMTVRRFEQEVKASINMTHPNLIAVYEQGATQAGAPYLVMDYIDGQDMSAIIEENFALRSGIPHPRVLDIFIQVCEGLEHAHNKGIVHRDIKPSNILVTSSDEHTDLVKLVDFGIAKILPAAGINVQTLTQTGEVFGSPVYMSPEQGRGSQVDQRSDFYSLGCVMYEALTGKPPFSGENPIETILAHLNDPPRPIEKRFGVSEDLEAVVKMCLEKKPDERYKCARELIDDLELVRSGKKTKARAKFTARQNAIKIRKVALTAFCIAAIPIAITVALIGQNTPWIAMDDEAKSLSLVGSSHFTEAEALYKKALTEAANHNASDTDKERILYDLASLYFEWPRRELAAQTFEEALTLSGKHAPDLQTATIYDYLCTLNTEWEKPKLAVEQGEKALAIRQHNGARPKLIANTSLHLSKAYRHLKEFDKAEASARTAIEILVKSQPADAAELAQSYIALDSAIFGDVYSHRASNAREISQSDKEKLDEAAQAARKAMSILLASEGPTDSTKRNGEWLANQLESHGRFEDAEQIRKDSGISARKYTFTLLKMTLSLDRHHVISSVSPDGPAYKAGLRDGDRLLEVDGAPIENLSSHQLVNKIRHPDNDDTELNVERDGRHKKFKIPRSNAEQK